MSKPEIDPRFLGGEKGMVVTRTSDMALTLAISHEGACDVSCNVSKAQAAHWLREIAEGWDPS